MLIDKEDIESITIESGKLIINAKDKYSVRHKIYIEIKNVETEIIKKFEQ
jgi:hypothetical protein